MATITIEGDDYHIDLECAAQEEVGIVQFVNELLTRHRHLKQFIRAGRIVLEFPAKQED